MQIVFQDPYSSLNPSMTIEHLFRKAADHTRRHAAGRTAQRGRRRCLNRWDYMPTMQRAIRTNSPVGSGNGMAIARADDAPSGVRGA